MNNFSVHSNNAQRDRETERLLSELELESESKKLIIIISKSLSQTISLCKSECESDNLAVASKDPNCEFINMRTQGKVEVLILHGSEYNKRCHY